MVCKQLDQTGPEGLIKLQKNIYNLIAERGKIIREELTSRLNLTPEEMKREFAVLRHCELLQAKRETL